MHDRLYVDRLLKIPLVQNKPGSEYGTIVQARVTQSSENV